MEITAPAPLCPGCHFGCRLDDFQCARGEKLFEAWITGAELPERRVPGAGSASPKGARRGGMPPFLKQLAKDESGTCGNSLAMLVTVLSRRVYSNMPPRGTTPLGKEDEPSMQVLEALLRHEGAASSFVVSGRTSMSEETIERIADEQTAAGTIAIEEYEDGTVFMRVTDVGKEKLRRVASEKSAFNEAVFSCLTHEEQTQLSRLLLRVVEESFR